MRRGASASPGDAARRARRSPGYRFTTHGVAEARSAPQVHWGRSPKGGSRDLHPLRRIAAVSVSSVASRGVPKKKSLRDFGVVAAIAAQLRHALRVSCCAC